DELHAEKARAEARPVLQRLGAHADVSETLNLHGGLRDLFAFALNMGRPQGLGKGAVGGPAAVGHAAARGDLDLVLQHKYLQTKFLTTLSGFSELFALSWGTELFSSAATLRSFFGDALSGFCDALSAITIAQKIL